jgi:hypothetical protein
MTKYENVDNFFFAMHLPSSRYFKTIIYYTIANGSINPINDSSSSLLVHDFNKAIFSFRIYLSSIDNEEIV